MKAPKSQTHPVKTALKPAVKIIQPVRTRKTVSRPRATAPEPTAPTAPVIPAQEIPLEGNNLALARDRAFADTLPANFQPPVEKTFVSPPDH